jgi:hypothetical protein
MMSTSKGNQPQMTESLASAAPLEGQAMTEPAAIEPDYDEEMRLPEGKTCCDCTHSKRCFGMGYSEPGRTSCDFWPTRFKVIFHTGEA